MKSQILLLTAALACIFLSTTIAQPTKVCEPGSQIKVQCNQCRCNKDGTNMVCTKRYCLEDEEKTENQAVENKDEDKDETNSEDKTSGSDRQIVDEIKERTKSEDADESCKPGEVYKEDCNTCTCAPSGRKSLSACTLLACDFTKDSKN